MVLTASSISSALLPLLPAGPRTITVHSAFDRALNIALGHGLLLTLAPQGAGNLPGGVLLSEKDWSALIARSPKPGDRVQLSRLAIQLPAQEMSIDLSAAQLWNPTPSLGCLASLKEVRSRLAAAARLFSLGWDVRRGDTAPQGATEPIGRVGFGTLLDARLSSLMGSLVAAERLGISRATEELVGFGPGLTPSGDDSLVGVLLVLRLLAAHSPPARVIADKLGGAIAGQAHRTTAVGESYLRYAAMGAFAEVPTAFAQGLLSAGGDWQQAAERLRCLGATSGADLARGVLAAAMGFLDEAT